MEISDIKQSLFMEDTDRVYTVPLMNEPDLGSQVGRRALKFL